MATVHDSEHFFLFEEMLSWWLLGVGIGLAVTFCSFDQLPVTPELDDCLSSAYTYFVENSLFQTTYCTKLDN
eukprot:1158363-Pelagomonas_calceolata.AAC.7